MALIGFTSGTTGEPKGTIAFHRDILIIADGYAREILNVQPDDIFVGSPPLAFTFGLGGLAVFPLRFGAAAALLEQASPPNLISIIEQYKATVCFTAPTAYRAMLKAMAEGADLSSLRAAVSAGETLPAPVYEEWMARTGKPMLDGIGATEMLHIFITNRFDDHRPGCTGRPVTGYEARIVDDEGSEAPAWRSGPPCGARAHRLPLSRRLPAEKIRAERLEPDGRQFLAGRGGTLSLRGALRRHDHFGGLQHRRARSRSGTAVASGGSGMRRGRSRRRRARHDRRGPCGAGGGTERETR